MLIKQQRYAHAKQLKRANKALREIRTMLGAVMRDITRKIAADAGYRGAQRPSGTTVQGLDRQPKARPNQDHQTLLQAPLCRRIHQGKTLYG
jgi:N-acetylglutamate synthase/N-acetylornithine aminotransferase